MAADLGDETNAARAAARPGDPASVVRVLVGEYERIGDANFRWAAMSDRLGDVAEVLDEARARHQQWLESLFADQLPVERTARRALRPTLRSRRSSASAWTRRR